MSAKRLSRREFLRLGAMVGAGATLAACATPTPQVIRETVVVKETVPVTVRETVIVAGTPQVVEKVVTKEVEKVVVATPAPREVVKVTWSNTDAIDLQDGYNKMAEAFNEKYAGRIQVEVKNFPGGGWAEKLAAMIAGNDAPDIFEHNVQPDDYPKRGTVQNLTPFIQRDNLKPEELWFEHAWKNFIWQGVQWAVPRSTHPSGFAVNKNIFEEAGVPLPTDSWTTDEFLDKCIRVRNKEKGIFAHAISGYGGVLWGSGAMVYGMGIEVISRDGRRVQGVGDSPESIEGYQFYLDMEVKYDLPAKGEQRQALGGFPFGSGKIALGGLDEELWTKGPWPFQWYPVRAPKHKNYPVHTWKGAVPRYMWSGSRRREEAWEVMKYISGPEATKMMWLSKTGFPSPCPSVWKEMGYGKYDPQEKDPIKLVFSFLYREMIELPTKKPFFSRTEYWAKCVLPGFQGIWVQYIEEKKRPLEPIVKAWAAEAQQCLDQQYAAEAQQG